MNAIIRVGVDLGKQVIQVVHWSCQKRPIKMSVRNLSPGHRIPLYRNFQPPLLFFGYALRKVAKLFCVRWRCQ